MTWPSTLGTQGLTARLSRAGTGLRLDLERHSLELATGRVAQPAAHLRGHVGPWVAVEARLGRIASQDMVVRAQAHLASSAQNALGRVSDAGADIRNRVMTVSSGEATPEALTRVGQAARSGLSEMISALSAQTAGRSVFAGTATDRGPLPDADVVMSAVTAHLASATTAQAVVTALDQFFDTPGGGFETAVYAGGPAAVGQPLPHQGATLSLPTAADPGIRAALRGAVLAAILAEPAILSDLAQRRELAGLATLRYPAEAEKLVSVRSTLGESEATFEAARTRLSSERDTLLQARSDLIGADPYAAASRLEETRARLEAVYAVTARVSRLSLTGYLR